MVINSSKDGWVVRDESAQWNSCHCGGGCEVLRGGGCEGLKGGGLRGGGCGGLRGGGC